jgi:hypothetical protein
MSTEANAKADRINRQRTAERQEREQEERQRLEQEVLQRYPGFSDIYNKKVADIDNDKERLLTAAEEFFSLSDEQASDYVRTPHRFEESAVEPCLSLERVTDSVGNYVADRYKCKCCLGDVVGNLL